MCVGDAICRAYSGSLNALMAGSMTRLDSFETLLFDNTKTTLFDVWKKVETNEAEVAEKRV